jgi:hypothetical protein
MLDVVLLSTVTLAGLVAGWLLKCYQLHRDQRSMDEAAKTLVHAVGTSLDNDNIVLWLCGRDRHDRWTAVTRELSRTWAVGLANDLLNPKTVQPPAAA